MEWDSEQGYYFVADIPPGSTLESTPLAKNKSASLAVGWGVCVLVCECVCVCVRVRVHVCVLLCVCRLRCSECPDLGKCFNV